MPGLDRIVWLTSLDPADREAILSLFSEEEREELRWYWPLWGRPEQIPPAGEWTTWPNRAQAFLYSAAEAESLHGPQHSRAPGPAQEELLVNEAHTLADALLHPVVSGLTSVPPASPSKGTPISWGLMHLICIPTTKTGLRFDDIASGYSSRRSSAYMSVTKQSA